MYKAIIIVGILVGAVVSGFALVNKPGVVEDIVDVVDEPSDNTEGSWHTVAVWRPGLSPLGEADPGAGSSGFLSIFLLDYAADVSTLGINGTDWEASGNVHAYADTDAFSEDVPSEDPFRIVVRARFTKAVCFDEGDNQFVGNRTKCKITFSGDESGTIVHYGNHTEAATGGGICSYNDSGGDALFVNFYFSDGVNGYRITDDGSLTISLIELSAKY